MKPQKNSGKTENNVLKAFSASINGWEWQERKHDERLSLTLSQKFSISAIMGKLLAMRGVDLDSAEDFLHPSLRNLMPDPSHLLDMDKASERISRAIINDENIVIFGDYDVDGATSSALLKRFLDEVGCTSVKNYIPNRIDDGYGPTSKAFMKFKKDGANLIITVDCGTASFEPIATAKKEGMDVVVLDHHLSTDTFPEAIAIVNPSRIDETSQYKNLAAVGVVFLLVVAVNRELRQNNWFKEKKEPNILKWLDLVALGTVCDAMKLNGLNRAYVAQGLKVMHGRKNRGLAALSDIIKLEGPPSVYHAGFMIGPRINAGGRIGQADLGVKLLTTENDDEAIKISLELDSLNLERRAIELDVTEEALAQVEGLDEIPAVIFVNGNGWHQGVVGIVASRLKDRYNRPVAVISWEKDKFGNLIGKGSARSVTGVDLGAAITAAKMNNLLATGGGHAMAAGFMLKYDQKETFFAFIQEKLEKHVFTYSKEKTRYFDGVLSVTAITKEFALELEKIGPFGSGNPEPRFVVLNARIIKVNIIAEKHVMCILDGGIKGLKNGKTIKAMTFNTVGTGLGNALINGHGKEFNMVGKIKLNRWNGMEKAEFTIEDMIET